MGAPAPSDGSAKAADRAALRFAMLSVYYGSLGRELSSQGAPAVLLPLPVRPLSLLDALDQIRERWPDRLRDAVWRVVRSVPPPGAPDGRGPDRYPRAVTRATDRDFGELDELRAHYAAAAAICAASDEPPAEPLDDLPGLDAAQYAGALGDAHAFLEWWPPDRAMAVQPAVSVISQDSRTLVTRVTVTALASCTFPVLARSCDPQCWGEQSDVVVGTRYVRDPYSLTPPQQPPRAGRTLAADRLPAMLEERVQVCWGFDERASGEFHNVLRIGRFDAVEAEGRIDVEFALARCVDSRILWDSRPGGIVLDQGFLKVRRSGRHRWRVTSHKTLLFSDRTPNATGPGWTDVGQMLNYLAPAALSWWLESELLSSSHETYVERARADAKEVE